MNKVKQKEAIRRFINTWNGKGYEKGQTQKFWMSFLSEILDVEHSSEEIIFEKEVKVAGHTKFIDAYIPKTRVMIEQKSAGKDLKRAMPQSGGDVLTPYEQAKRYANNLPVDEMPKWIITCNFKEFHIYDMNKPGEKPIEIQLENLQREIHLFDFLITKENKEIVKEDEVSLQAGELVGALYEALLKQYKNPESDRDLKSLNALCVRLVFCLYAEDAGVFEKHGMFHDYLMRFEARDLRKAIIDLFEVLNTEVRSEYLDADLKEFPYVNGGLFESDENEIPQFTDEIRDILLRRASADFNWSSISPTIFGAVFESTLNPETRRTGGMHYTSVENIHKVIDPLFLNELTEEFEEIEKISSIKTRNAKIEAFRKKLGSLKFLDPAAGSGNFLTETYLSLRRLENKALKLYVEKGQIQGQISMGDDIYNPIEVSIGQFYGIEINDFAVSVARTALWIAESQMIKETEDIIHQTIDFLPLTNYPNIIEGNALRINWEGVVPKNELNYIMGNPPFVGQSVRNKEQSSDMSLIWGCGEIETKLDYVICWYKKSLDYIADCKHKIDVAFVSTNSICQGESVPTFWKKMIDGGVQIQFAHKSFIWNSEATDKAAVHCVIVGLSNINNTNVKCLYDEYGVEYVNHINPYLYSAPDVWITNRINKPQNGLPKMTTGSPPTDDGALTLTLEEKKDLEQKYPILSKYIKPFIGAREFLHDKVGNYTRYCLWFENGNVAEYGSISEIKERLQKVKLLRENSSAERIKKMALYPYLFCQIRQPKTTYLVFPRHSSQNRRYIPIGFVDPNVIAGDACSIIPDVTLYEFGILTSNVHNAWLRVVCGRIKSDFRYSPAIYNNFPWCNPTDEQKAEIEKTAQGILDARSLYPDCSLADLYDELTMPAELRKAHQANDRAVMRAYGFSVSQMSESDCVAELMKMYKKMTE